MYTVHWCTVYIEMDTLDTILFTWIHWMYPCEKVYMAYVSSNSLDLRCKSLHILLKIIFMKVYTAYD